MTMFYKLADLQRITGSTGAQLENWIRLGLIKPVKDSNTSGVHRGFDRANATDPALHDQLLQLVAAAHTWRTPAVASRPGRSRTRTRSSA